MNYDHLLQFNELSRHNKRWIAVITVGVVFLKHGSLSLKDAPVSWSLFKIKDAEFILTLRDKHLIFRFNRLKQAHNF